MIEGEGNSKGDPVGVVSWRGRRAHQLVLEKEKLRPLNSIPVLQRPCEVSSNSWLLLSLEVTGKMHASTLLRFCSITVVEFCRSDLQVDSAGVSA